MGVVVEYMNRSQGPTVNFSSQNLHLAESEPGKIDPMCTPEPDPACPRPVRGSHSESDESTQTQSTSGISITVLDILSVHVCKVLERQQNWLTCSQCPPTDACSRWRRGGRRNSDFQLVHADSGCSPVVFRSLLRHMDSMDTPAAFGLSICATGAGAA